MSRLNRRMAAASEQNLEYRQRVERVTQAVRDIADSDEFKVTVAAHINGQFIEDGVPLFAERVAQRVVEDEINPVPAFMAAMNARGIVGEVALIAALDDAYASFEIGDYPEDVETRLMMVAKYFQDRPQDLINFETTLTG